LSPKVSVLLPVYNGAPWLAEAVQSVLEQSFTDFELIIIDDGSTDCSWDVISTFGDTRIHATRQVNVGLAATLNRGLRLARAPYVARQDQDDWMYPDRLRRQVAYLQENPDCAAVGTWAEIRVDGKGSSRTHKHPVSSEAIRLMLLLDNPFVHSSMLLRRDAVVRVGAYCEDRNRQPPEDYELWSRLAADYPLANIGSVLTAYREVVGSMSRAGSNPFRDRMLTICTENLCRLFDGQYSVEECRSLAALFHGVAVPFALSRGRALAIIEDAALTIGGPQLRWSSEFRDVYTYLTSKISARTWLQYVPDAVSNAALGIKRRFLR
jgi:glycosyltransferase involved in cell wall biosynthesis